ncbi:MAG TPA: ScyD/ScyE family protein [Jatrophihabitans sp.]|nr:ScyD/ScyE family protein [Jatrophihabitans sp.]
MRRVHHRTAVACIAAAGALTAGLMFAPASSSAHGAHITTVLSGLNAPRGITFDNWGHMYVAESGVAGTGPAGLTDTGRVSKYDWGSTTPDWSTSFQSLYVTEDPSQPPDVLGPEGISASCPSREHDSSARVNGDYHHHGGCTVQMIMSESHDGVAAATKGAVQTKDAGHLYGLDPRTGTPTDLSDVGDQSYAFTTAHKHLFPPDFPDANPFGVLVVRDHHGDEDSRFDGDDHHGQTRTFVVDAAANTVNEIMPDGTERVVAYIPNERRKPFRDSTPTCAAMGPDGYLYVGTLDLLANFAHPGRSKIYRVDPNGNFPTRGKLWTKGGLTTLTSCTFDRWGNFWATEMFKPTSGPPGDVVKIPFHDPSERHYIGAGQLPLPGGITQGPDGAMYVTVNSANPQPGSGAVMRISTYHHHH